MCTRMRRSNVDYQNLDLVGSELPTKHNCRLGACMQVWTSANCLWRGGNCSSAWHAGELRRSINMLVNCGSVAACPCVVLYCDVSFRAALASTARSWYMCEYVWIAVSWLTMASCAHLHSSVYCFFRCSCATTDGWLAWPRVCHGIPGILPGSATAYVLGEGGDSLLILIRWNLFSKTVSLYNLLVKYGWSRLMFTLVTTRKVSWGTREWAESVVEGLVFE
jgi:hypothetical protein